MADSEQVNIFSLMSYVISQNLKKRKKGNLLIEILQFFSKSDYKWNHTLGIVIGTFDPLSTNPTKRSTSNNSSDLEFLTP